MSQRLRLLLSVLLAIGMAYAGTMVQPADAQTSLAAEEDRMLAMVNEHRAENGLPALRMHPAFREMARRHAHRMAAEGRIYHNPNLGPDAEAAIPGWKFLGENVGVGPSTEAVEQAFLNSPKHRQNIETGRFNIVGIGAVETEDGRLFFTQNFADWAPKPAAPAEPAVAPRSDPPVRAPAPVRATPVPATPVPAPVQPVQAVTPEEPVAAATPTTDVLGAEAEAAPTDTEEPSLLSDLAALLSSLIAKLSFWD